MPLNCHETADGDVECDINWEEEATFQVDHLEDTADMISNHFDMFCEAERQLDLVKIDASIKQAVQDYDRLVKGLIEAESLRQFAQNMPEYKCIDRAAFDRLRERKHEYDTFNLLNFYEFCLVDPLDGSRNTKYCFADEKRS